MKAVDVVEKIYPMIKKDERVKKVLDIMYKSKVDRIIVLKDSNTLYGLATEWDIFYKLSMVKETRDEPYDLPLSSVTTYPVDTALPDTPVKTIINQFLRREYSSIPITDERIYGLVTKRGVIRNYLNRLREVDKRIEEIMTKPKGIIQPFSSLKNAENKLRLGGFSTLIVHDNKTYIGVITALDIAKELLKIRKLFPKKDWDKQVSKLSVADIMRRDFKTLLPEANIYEAARIFADGWQKLIPILEDEINIVGVVTRRHILKELLPLS